MPIDDLMSMHKPRPRICPSLVPLTRWGLCVVLALGAALMAGCGGSEPFKLVPVSGKVTYEDGSLIPAKRIVVVFQPQVEAADAKTHPRPGRAEVNVADGTFSFMTSHKAGDGATVGPNKVLVTSYDDRENVTGEVPAVYGSLQTTPLKVEVGKGSDHFDLSIKRP